MRKSVSHLLSTLLAVALLLGACASAPIQEMSDARQAITAARQVVDESAPRHARTGIERAAALLEQAETQLRAGEYASARELAREAKVLAIEARERAAHDNVAN